MEHRRENDEKKNNGPINPFTALVIAACLLCCFCTGKSPRKSGAASNGAAAPAVVEDSFVDELPDDFSTPLGIFYHKLWAQIDEKRQFEMSQSDIPNSLFGMSMWTKAPESAPECMRDEFTFYNPEVLKLIDSLLDAPPVRRLLRNVASVPLTDGIQRNETIDYGAPGIENRFDCRLLMHRLQCRESPELLEKYRKRYERYMLTEENAGTPVGEFDLKPEPDGKMAAFWTRRSYDGTDIYFESILRKVINITSRDASAFVDSAEKSMHFITADRQVFVTYDSYSDEFSLDPDASLYPGRERLLNRNARYLDSISEFQTNAAIDDSVTGEPAETMLREKSGYSLFTGKYTFHGIFRDGAVASWQRFTPVYTVVFRSHEASCGEPGITWSEHLFIGAQGDSAYPLLIVALAPEYTNAPGPRVFIPEAVVDSSTVPASDTAGFTLTTDYRLPEGVAQIERLLKEEFFGYMGGMISSVVCTMAVLTAVGPDGSERTVYTDTGYGHYTFVNAEITDVLLTDINGDGMIDISFTGNSNGKHIALQRRNNTFELKTIKKPCDVAVGGC